MRPQSGSSRYADSAQNVHALLHLSLRECRIPNLHLIDLAIKGATPAWEIPNIEVVPHVFKGDAGCNNRTDG